MLTEDQKHRVTERHVQLPGHNFDAVSVVNTDMTSNLTVSPLLLEFLYDIGASGQNSRLLIIKTLVGRL